MANEEWGPLAGLIGTWESGLDGLDVSFHNDEGKVAETPYREKTTFKPFGPVDNGDQCLYGLDYRTAAYRQGEDNPFHTEVGYWMWDATNKQVTRCFVIPRAQVLMAGATVEPDATSFTLESTLGSVTYGILSNRHLDEFAHTTRFDVTVSFTEDTFSYDETTVIEHKRSPTVIMHTDRNTLKLVSREA
ncbi:MAG TPA: heme-binding beta-barrel domain-containing protein [Acidimicrobiales bacterium]|nr:heme-binding beta-barrel domain-containing protein [Acidimicrobiales bacterium]